MRLSRLPAEYIQANIRYFSEIGYEPEEIKRRVADWLEGKEDKEVCEKVLSWLQKEVDWITHILPFAVRQYWYFAPFTFFIGWHTRRIWKQEIARLEKEPQE